MDKRKLITNICFILFSIALIVGVSFVFLFLISRYSVERSLRNLLAFSAVGIIAFIGFMLCGGYRIFKKTADGINGANAKSLLKKFVPAVSKKAWIICGSIVLVLPFVFEGVFCWLERANPSGLYHAYSFTNVLLWLVFFIIFGYLTLLYLSSRPKTLKSEEGVRFTDEHLSKWEYFLFGVIALGCFFLFNQEDLMITVGCSFGVLRGHISDYYDFMNSVWGSPNYMITTFLVFAIWNVPVRLITGSQYYTPTVDISVPVIWWNKLLLVLIFLLSVAVLFRICKKAGMNGSNSRLSCYLYACSPITIFSVFIFGQYDVLSVLMLLMGIYLLLDDRDVWSAFFIGIGLTFKITILLFYLPWLLIKRKNLVHVLGLLLISLAPYALLTIYYSNSSLYSSR